MRVILEVTQSKQKDQIGTRFVFERREALTVLVGEIERTGRADLRTTLDWTSNPLQSALR